MKIEVTYGGIYFTSEGEVDRECMEYFFDIFSDGKEVTKYNDRAKATNDGLYLIKNDDGSVTIDIPV